MNVFGIGQFRFNFAVLHVKGDLMHDTYSVTIKWNRTTNKVVVLSSKILPSFSHCNKIESLDLQPSVIWHRQKGLKVAASYLFKSKIKMKPVTDYFTKHKFI